MLISNIYSYILGNFYYNILYKKLKLTKCKFSVNFIKKYIANKWFYCYYYVVIYLFMSESDEEILMIEFRNVSKTYDTGTEAVHKANFNIEKGEFAFLVGTSGSGKSTLIKLLLKEENPTSGNIIINGKDTTYLKPKRVPFLRRSMGVVFQDFRLLPDKTVYDNVAFAMYIVNATKRHIRRQVPMVLSLVGLSNKAKVYPNELSGGEQQRVALARALVNNPSMLIADEPTGNLDPDTAWDIMTLLDDINKRGTTVVVATHAKDIVDKMKKRVIQIEDGHIIRDDKKGGYNSEV